MHIDTADGGIPVSCVLTAASVHDSQVAIPLATLTAGRVTNLYDLMDSAYDAAAVKQHSRDLGHVPIIDVNPRATPGLKQELADEAKRQRCVGHRLAEQVRYGERSTAERVNAGLKDNHGARTVWVRGPDKVMCHLMFGVLSFTVLQLLRLIVAVGDRVTPAPPHRSRRAAFPHRAPAEGQTRSKFGAWAAHAPPIRKLAASVPCRIRL